MRREGGCTNNAHREVLVAAAVFACTAWSTWGAAALDCGRERPAVWTVRAMQGISRRHAFVIETSNRSSSGGGMVSLVSACSEL